MTVNAQVSLLTATATVSNTATARVSELTAEAVVSNNTTARVSELTVFAVVSVATYVAPPTPPPDPVYVPPPYIPPQPTPAPVPVAVPNQTAWKAETALDVVYPVDLVWLDFPGAPFRCCTLNVPLTLDLTFVDNTGVQTFQPMGQVGSITGMDQTTDLSSTTVTFSLSGIPSDQQYAADLISEAFNLQYRGRTARVYRVFLDQNFHPIPNAVVVWSGRMDIPTIQDQDDKITISLTAESALVAGDGTSPVYMNQQGQNRRFPADRGFDYVTFITGKKVYWGTYEPVLTIK